MLQVQTKDATHLPMSSPAVQPQRNRFLAFLDELRKPHGHGWFRRITHNRSWLLTTIPISCCHKLARHDVLCVMQHLVDDHQRDPRPDEIRAMIENGMHPEGYRWSDARIAIYLETMEWLLAGTPGRKHVTGKSSTPLVN